MILNVYLYTQKLFITSPFSKSNRPASATATSDTMVSQPRPHGLGGLEDEGEIESTRNVDLNQLGMWFVAPKIFFLNQHIWGNLNTIDIRQNEANCNASLGTKDELVSSTVCVQSNKRWKKLGATYITEKEMQMCVFVSTIFSGRFATHRA